MYAKRIQDYQRKPSSIRRGMSFATLVLSGNLFSTRFFNNIIEAFSKYDISFRIIEWEVGNTSLKQASVTVQIVAKDHVTMDRLMDEIEDEAAKHNVEINEGTGPQYENELPKMIHQDRVR